MSCTYSVWIQLSMGVCAHSYNSTKASRYSQPPLNHTHPFCPKNIRMCRGTGLANDSQNVQCTCHVCSTVKMYDFFTCIHDAYIHVWRKPAQARKIKNVPIYTHEYTCAAKCKHVWLLATGNTTENSNPSG